MFKIETLILNALKEKEIFIGYFMLCRYLNGKGYIRYGCNAGYNGKFYPKSNPKNRLPPCKIICPSSMIYHSKVRYWCRKLEKEGKLFLKKTVYRDSNNPNSPTKAHKKGDVFIFICLNKTIFNEFIKKKTLVGFL